MRHPPFDRCRPRPQFLVAGHLLRLPRSLAPWSRPITRRSVYGVLALHAGAPPVSCVLVARALTLFPRPRHVRRAALCMAALARRGMVPEEMIDQGPH